MLQRVLQQCFSAFHTYGASSRSRPKPRPPRRRSWHMHRAWEMKVRPRPERHPHLPARSPSPARGGGTKPVFDVAVIGRAGDAVITGTGAPGATLELLRNGELQDRVVADQSGQFVMTPSQLPPGDYKLTLRSMQPDGKQATSQQSVAVSVQPSLKDQLDAVPVTPEKASVVVSVPMAPSATCHPSKARKRWAERP